MGENVAGLNSQELPPFLGAILISPFVDLAAGGIKSRFDKVTLPLMAITGTQDTDPFGITSPSLRSAIFSQSPPGGKYLLDLNQGTHRQLAGIDPSAINDEESDSDETNRNIAEDDQIMRGENSIGSGRKRRSQHSHPEHPEPTAMDQGHYNPRQIGQQLALIKRISTTFLNAVAKKDAAALNWLSSEAQTLGNRLAVFRKR